MTDRIRRIGLLSALGLIATIGIAAPSHAQSSTSADGNWLAWHGCWRASSDAPGFTETEGEIVCVLPGEDVLSARFATIEDGEIARETLVRANGVDRPVEEGGCSGIQRAFFSDDGRRVFTRAELTCSRASRISTGVLSFVTADSWVDAQAISVLEQHAARSIRYEAIPASQVPASIAAQLPGDLRLAQEATRLDASAPLGIDAIAEASRNLAPPALEGLLAATPPGFTVDAETLVALDERGIPGSAIDLVIARAYPERFEVREREPAPLPATGLASSRIGMFQECYDPLWFGSRYGFDCFGYPYGYRYDRFGYSPWGYDRYGWRYGSDPIFVVVDPRGEPREEQGGGKVVKGRGYVPSSSSSDGSPPASRAREPRRESPSPSARPAPSRGDSGSAGTGSSGSGSARPTRTAKPRGSN